VWVAAAAGAQHGGSWQAAQCKSGARVETGPGAGARRVAACRAGRLAREHGAQADAGSVASAEAERAGGV
jgi:hypothetical protein